MITTHFLLPLSPVLALLASAMLLLGVECFDTERKHPALRRFPTLLGPVLSIVCTWIVSSDLAAGTWSAPPLGTPQWIRDFSGYYTLDSFTLALYWAIATFTLLAGLFTGSQLKDILEKGEVSFLLHLIAVGMMLLVSAKNLVVVFTALELMSLPTYVLVGIRHRDLRSLEASLKYYLFGSFASVLLVFAIALLYSFFGTLDLGQIFSMTQALGTGVADQSPYLLISVALLIVAIGFKVGLAPFHMWVPDTYEGAPGAITGFMGSAVKLAGFGLAVRLFWGMLGPLAVRWGQIIGWLSVATMLIGNLAALRQENLKRLFAYSSVAHAGYLGLGLVAIGNLGQDYQALFYYLVVYGLMFLGAFAVFGEMEKNGQSLDIQSLSGLGFQSPVLGVCLTLFVLSAAGIPPTAGFLAKYFIFFEAVQKGFTPLVVLGVISSLIGVYYYLKVIVALYMREPVTAGTARSVSVSPAVLLGIVLCALSVLYFAATPSRLGM